MPRRRASAAETIAPLSVLAAVNRRLAAPRTTRPLPAHWTLMPAGKPASRTRAAARRDAAVAGRAVRAGRNAFVPSSRMAVTRAAPTAFPARNGTTRSVTGRDVTVAIRALSRTWPSRSANCTDDARTRRPPTSIRTPSVPAGATIAMRPSETSWASGETTATVATGCGA